VRVGLKPKSNTHPCAKSTIDELERRLSWCSVLEFNESDAPSWQGVGALLLQPDDAGKVAATNIRWPEVIGKQKFGPCAAEQIAELELIADVGTSPVEVPLVFESVVTGMAD
jgi:hypothetical protein